MTFLKVLNNQKGSLIVNAIATTIIMGIISGVILQQSLSTMKTLRLPRIKSAMTSVEASVRHALLQPGNFAGCESDIDLDGDTVIEGFASCQVTATTISSTFEQIPGCQSGTPLDCGVRLQNPVFDGASRTFTAQIIYDGSELPVASRALNVVVPKEILLYSRNFCPAATPIFVGFDANGVKICRALDPANTNGCSDPFEYMAFFDPNTMAYTCNTIGNATQNCPAGQMVNGITFTGTGFSVTCGNRIDPNATGWPIAP